MMVNEIEQIKHGKMFPGCEGEWKRRVVVSNRVAGWGNHWEDNFGAKAWRRWGIELDWILGEEASRQRKQSMQKTWGRTMPDTFIEKQIGIEWKRGKRRQVREALGQAMYPVSYNTESYKFVREVLFFFSFSAAPMAYGNSQARDWFQAPDVNNTSFNPLCQAKDWTWTPRATQALQLDS